MAKRIGTRLLLLEALVKLGPSRGMEVGQETRVPKGSLYAGLERMRELGYVESEGEGEERRWTVTGAGKAVARALRILHNTGP